MFPVVDVQGVLDNSPSTPPESEAGLSIYPRSRFLVFKKSKFLRMIFTNTIMYKIFFWK